MEGEGRGWRVGDEGKRGGELVALVRGFPTINKQVKVVRSWRPCCHDCAVLLGCVPCRSTPVL